MAFFSGLDSQSISETSSTSSRTSRVDLMQVELLQLANAGENSIETKLGINDSSRIVLDIIKLAKRAKSHRKECCDIADQAYLLLNAVDGGVKGRALDVNIILRDHIARLNEDLGQIYKIIKGFASWWILFRTWSAPRGLEKCHNILHHGMDMYLLLLRCSLAQPTIRRQVKQIKRFSAVSPPPPQTRALPKSARRSTYPSPKSRPLPSTSSTPWAQPPYQSHKPLGAGAF